MPGAYFDKPPFDCLFQYLPAIAPQPTIHRWNHETVWIRKKEMNCRLDLVNDLNIGFEKGNGLCDRGKKEEEQGRGLAGVAPDCWNRSRRNNEGRISTNETD
jgi:hypothetical protein